MAFPHPPAAAQAALSTLIQADPDLGRVLDQAGPLPWRTRTPGFPGLLQAIVAQMISNRRRMRSGAGFGSCPARWIRRG